MSDGLFSPLLLSLRQLCSCICVCERACAGAQGCLCVCVSECARASVRVAELFLAASSARALPRHGERNTGRNVAE